MEFSEVARARRMTRAFSSEPISPGVIEACVDLAARSPSAGKSHGWHLVVVEGDRTHRYWDVALPVPKRAGFAFPGLLDAPFVAIVLADPAAYLARYSEPDKAATGLGRETGAWPAPYWTIDAAFATMTFLLALEDAGLGALFFAHANEKDVREEFSIPERLEILGVVCAGHRAPVGARRGRSAARSGRDSTTIIHRDRW